MAISEENSSNANTQVDSTVNFERFITFMRQFSQFQAQLNRSNSSSPISDPISLYYLHPSESPGTALIPFQLTFQNYYQWSHDMWRAFRSKNKDYCNNILLSWLNLSLSPEIAKSVIRISNASDLWKDLKNRYSHGDVFIVRELKEKFYTIRQGDLTVTSYLTKLKSVWEELENIRIIPSCIACVNGCNCGLKIIRDYAYEEYIVKFLRGLNEQYSTVKSQIMLLKPLHDINAVLAMLTQQERELSLDFLDTKIITNFIEVQHR
ncbi:uncharacterized protein LOC127746717 [Arachis duranensis]|uniref:Uncharacterized protein LOC127746717 n=1 Tax=Arachis duranensis TaxID=130453 RepID=A0A9C6TMG0_ARADU|nr:uncharacterized protein LOC127746717 [Arachis duranensis]